MENPAPNPGSPQPAGGAPAKKVLRTFAEFLESAPPDAAEEVSDLSVATSYSPTLYVHTPDLHLHCDVCGGVRVFHTDASPTISGGLEFETITYKCRNCCRTVKTYSLVMKDGKSSGIVQKLGELPPFGPPTPTRLFKLVGEEDRELFLKGRRAELRGLGIGAFAYYRRIVEQQKGRIIEEIGKVAVKLKPSSQTAELFAKAKVETQFSKAIETIKAAIPESLLIDGHNPLTLLHDALSEGLHAQTDEECLELATSIRVVLTELAERISVALKEEAELKSAVGRLLNRKSG
jgi:hypothetical protein